jgi:hypothetical protein
MLSLNDNRWKVLNGGYRQPYDASILLRKLESVSDNQVRKSILTDLFDELHHQGDVDLASYYAVPHLVRIATKKQLIDFDILWMVTTIEIESHRNNPPIPADLTQDYEHAIEQLGELGKSAIKEEWDLSSAAATLAAIAASKGQIELARAIIILEDTSTLKELLDTY